MKTRLLQSVRRTEGAETAVVDTGYLNGAIDTASGVIIYTALGVLVYDLRQYVCRVRLH